MKMSDHVYSVTEIVGTSKTGIEDAIENALGTAKKLCEILSGLR